MCGIVATVAANTIVGDHSTEAGRKFLEQVSLGKVKLVVGTKSTSRDCRL